MHRSLTSLCLLLVFPLSALAAASTSLGPSDAVKCYEESRFSLSLQGISYCTDAIRHGGLNKRDLAATYSNRGIIYSRNGKFEKALEDHNRAINISPSLAKAYINRGTVLYRTHEFEAALAEFEKAISRGGGPATTLLINKSLALIKLERLDEAISTLELALQEAPNSEKIKGYLQDLNSVSDRQ